MKNGGVAYWFDDAELSQTRKPLDQNIEADVVIVGAGFSGLWTAYYLKQRAPELSIAILEARFVGFGASGRSGGHLNNSLPGLKRLYLKQHSPSKVIQFQREINSTIDEVVRIAEAENIEAGIVKAGSVTIALNAAQLARRKAAYERQSNVDDGGPELSLLDQDEISRFVKMDGALGGTWTPHWARVQPAKLAKGLARAVERIGVKIYEGSHVASIEENKVTLSNGLLAQGRHIIRATEGFTAEMPGKKRDWLPKLSAQIITEELPKALINEIWAGDTMANDAGHMFCYLHKTADNRIAIGGPGLPYYWGSRTDDDGFTEPSSIRDLKRKLHSFFPALTEFDITHAWTGVLGVPRDWSPTVSLNKANGLGVVGGYVGSGLTATNLAGRTMAELIVGDRTVLSELPWVNKQIRKWEVEPVRWVALRGLYKAYVVADFFEGKSTNSSSSWIATAANRVSGRY